jgi:hypothetical protein
VAKLEDFLQGKPLNERMGRLMAGEEDDDAEAQSPKPEARTYAAGTAITNDDREHLRHTLAGHGWQVLLKLLDTALQAQEDAARRLSLQRTSSKDEIAATWQTVAANREARMALVGLAEAEVGKLKAKKKTTAENAENAKLIL